MRSEMWPIWPATSDAPAANIPRPMTTNEMRLVAM